MTVKFKPSSTALAQSNPRANRKFAPMLAASATTEEIENFQFPLLASPKLDGIRAIVIDGKVMSRSMKPIRNKRVQELFAHLEGFDGELILGDPTDTNCFNHSTALMGEELRNDVAHLPINFYVFDLIPTVCDLPAAKRCALLKEKAHGYKDLNVHYVGQTIVNSLEELLDFEKQMLEAGYEGVMVKSPDGLYKQGRSTLKQRLLTKVKRFQDDEAEIIGFEEKMVNIGERKINELGYSETSDKKGDFAPAGTLGALVVKDIKTGITFAIGSGFDDKTRAELWADKDNLKGKIVKYKHFTVGVKEAPRFPTFLGFRNIDDMSE